MKPEFDVGGGGDTIWAVFLGAFLATLGGFVATQLENWFKRRERHRGAAMLFADILSALGYLTKLAGNARGRGDPYGPVTMRLLRAARREIDLYDRNRESLYDIHDHALRIRVHTLVVSITMPLDGVFDIDTEIRNLAVQIVGLKAGTVARREADRRLAMLNEMRDAGFDFVLDTALGTQPLVEDLSKIAKHPPHRFDRDVL